MTGDGIIPSEAPDRRDDRERFRKVDQKPQHLYLIAQGFVPESPIEEDELYLDDENEQLPEPVYRSRHIILARLEQSKETYRIGDLLENAGAETIERILAYGIPEEEIF